VGQRVPRREDNDRKPEVDRVPKLRRSFEKNIKRKGLPPTEHHTYKKLRQALKIVEFESVVNDDTRKSVWRAYERAKDANSQILSSLTDKDWDGLWKSTTLKSVHNKIRTFRVVRLYGDMESAGLAISPAQRREYLECLSTSGQEELALTEWKKDGASTDDPAHLRLGIKLYALAGNADNAREIMDELLENDPDEDPSIMMTVFRALTSSEMYSDHIAAKTLYDRLKGHSLSMTLAQYDSCLVGFLEAKHLPYSLAVFHDMIVDGLLPTTGYAEDVERVLRRLHMLYRLGTDISTITTIILDAVAILPVAYQGYLYGEWMKLAVVQKQPGATAKILDMMYRRGYEPETYHLNMLLRALIRTEETPNVLRAENIGWRMIDEARKAYLRNGKPAPPSAAKTTSVGALRNLPPADADTFALIMHHHGKTMQWEHVDYISRQLKETSVFPNTPLMNVLMDNKIRQGLYTDAWSMYQQLTNPSDWERGVFPDGASMRHLWKMLRLALANEDSRTDPSLPTPRALLKETKTWWSRVRFRPDAARFHQGLSASTTDAIPRLMLHCFSYTSDLAGALVALHVLHALFDIPPSDAMVHIVHRQVAWVNVEPGAYYHPREVARGWAKIRKVWTALARKRMAALAMEGREVEDLSDHEFAEIKLQLLSEFLKWEMRRRHGREMAEEMVRVAKESIGYWGDTGETWGK
jgi:hypothetical protein